MRKLRRPKWNFKRHILNILKYLIWICIISRVRDKFWGNFCWINFEYYGWGRDWNCMFIMTLILYTIFFSKLMVFSFLPKNVHFISKNLILCLFLKNVSPSKRVVFFILNNLHFPMVEGIAFYALHKSRVLIIPCKADGFCLFIGLSDEI